MNWETAGSIGMMMALQAHDNFNIDVSKRVDVFEVIQRIDILLAFRPFPNLSAAYFSKPRFGIIINSNHPLSRQRYSAAHELGHHLFGHGTVADTDCSRFQCDNHVVDDKEKLSESFAAWFLMPDDLVRATLAKLRISEVRAPSDVYRLALHLGTSYEATAHHLVHLRLASPKQLERWLKVRVRDVKGAIANGWAVQQGDVWCFFEEDDGRQVVVRPGDRLVFAFDKKSSPSDRWEIIDAPGLRLVDCCGRVARQQSLFDDACDMLNTAECALVLEACGEVVDQGSALLQLRKAKGSSPDDSRPDLRITVTIEPNRRGFAESRFAKTA